MMTHDYLVSTIGEHFTKITKHGQKQGSFCLNIVLDEADDWSVHYESENEDRVIVHGQHLVTALGEVRKELGL